ncbi:MAG: hypothetical protein QM736_29020 [Vicinamibacterales bacterium]
MKCSMRYGSTVKIAAAISAGAVLPVRCRHEDEHPESGSDETGQQHQVVDQRRRESDPEERCRDDPFEHGRVRIREGASGRVEDVRVEERPRRRQRMRDPAQTPDAEERIVMVRDP